MAAVATKASVGWHLIDLMMPATHDATLHIQSLLQSQLTRAHDGNIKNINKTDNNLTTSHLQKQQTITRLQTNYNPYLTHSNYYYYLCNIIEKIIFSFPLPFNRYLHQRPVDQTWSQVRADANTLFVFIDTSKVLFGAY